MHEWQSQTLKFVKSVDLNNAIIALGPLTIITVDEGYSAVCLCVYVYMCVYVYVLTT